MRHLTAVLIIAATVAAAALACGPTTKDRCTVDSECAQSEYCDAPTGLCVLKTGPQPQEDGGEDGGFVTPLSLTGGALPEGIVDQPYETTLQATGGTAPYTWRLLSSAPELSWVSLDSTSGTLSGAPTAASAPQSLEVEVTDSTGAHASATYQLGVRSCANGETVSCYVAAGNACSAGERTCQNGQLGACTATASSSDPKHCGAACDACDSAADGCISGKCVCGAGAACAGTTPSCCGGGCVNTATDPDHCGSCTTACDTTRTNASRSCVGGTCEYPCAAGFDRCPPNETEPGCTTNLTNDSNNCGACGNACTKGPHVTQVSCSSSKCIVLACEAGWEDCDGDATNGCEIQTSSDVNNCGGCQSKGLGAVCAGPVANGTPSCVSGQCKAACANGYGDCDNNYSTGCEVNLTNDKSHCGTCSTVCQANASNSTAVCVNSACSFSCNTGYGNCDNTASNYCETNTTNDVLHCGSCTNNCGTRPNASTSCSSSSCAYACNSGFANCNNNMTSDGCEVNLSTSLQHCGTCANACNTQKADNCAGGQCRCGANAPCGAGLRCSGGQCICDTLSGCAGCCSLGTTCVTNVTPGACGAGGSVCVNCPGCTGGTRLCTAGTCDCG